MAIILSGDVYGPVERHGYARYCPGRRHEQDGQKPAVPEFLRGGGPDADYPVPAGGASRRVAKITTYGRTD